MGSTKRSHDIRLRSFGTVTGLVHERNYAYAEVLMTWPELDRIFDACREYEKGRKKPDEKLVAALDIACRKASGRFSAAVVTAEVPIAPVLRSVTPGFK